MRRHVKNLILTGDKQGVSITVRGYYVRMKIWHMLITSPTPLQSIDIINSTNLSYDQVKSWLDTWVKFGYVLRAPLAHGSSSNGGKRFTHTPADTNPYPPAINLKGQVKPVEHRQLIWEALRDYKALTCYFTAKELQYTIETANDVLINHDYLSSYLWDLYRAGYLSRQSFSEYGRSSVYSLLHDTGILAPSLCRGGKVFDANLGVLVT